MNERMNLQLEYNVILLALFTLKKTRSFPALKQTPSFLIAYYIIYKALVVLRRVALRFNDFERLCSSVHAWKNSDVRFSCQIIKTLFIIYVAIARIIQLLNLCDISAKNSHAFAYFERVPRRLAIKRYYFFLL